MQGLSCHFVFFWKPHLRKILPLDKLEEDAKQRLKHALVIKAYVKTSFIRRIMTKTRPYCDRRQAIFRIKRHEYTASKCKYTEPVFDSTNHHELGHRLFRYQDRVDEIRRVQISLP